jgi:hypothetical protein
LALLVGSVSHPAAAAAHAHHQHQEHAEDDPAGIRLNYLPQLVHGYFLLSSSSASGAGLSVG